MKYVCNECNSFFDDDDLKCICGSTDIEELVECNSCHGEYRKSDIDENGICYNCLNKEEQDEEVATHKRIRKV